MKKVISFLLFLLPIALSAQIDIFNLSLTDSSLNYIYMGVENKLRVTGLANTDNIKLVLSNGKTVQDTIEKNIFYARVSNFNIDTAKLYRNDSLILKKEFVNTKINAAKTIFAGLTDSTATVDQIFSGKAVLDFTIPLCEYNFNTTISSFKVVFMRKNGFVLKTYLVKGNQLSGEQLIVLKQLEKGDKIIFTEIKTPSPALYIRKLTVTIK